MGRPFDHVLRLPGAQLEDLALAIAAEFATVDFAAAHERLDWLAGRSARSHDCRRSSAPSASSPSSPGGAATPGRRAILADPSIAPTIVFDPAGVMSRPPSEPAWLCPHVTSAMLLEALAARYLERGEIGEAVRALELADELPLVRQRRERVSARLHALRSRLN